MWAYFAILQSTEKPCTTLDKGEGLRLSAARVKMFASSEESIGPFAELTISQGLSNMQLCFASIEFKLCWSVRFSASASVTQHVS